MKIGDRVIVDRIYFDHLVHRDEETEEAPDERQRKSLKRFMGKVGTISSIGRTGGMEAHTQYMVFFHNQEELVKFVKENKCGPWTDVVKLYYAEEHGSSTKGSYPAIYMWR